MLGINAIKTIFSKPEAAEVIPEGPIYVRGYDPYAGEWVTGGYIAVLPWPYCDEFNYTEGVYIILANGGTTYIPNLPGWITEL